MATPPKKPTDGTKPPAPRKPATPRKTTTRKTAAATPAKPATRKADPAPAAKPPASAKPATRKPAAGKSTASKPAARRASATKATTTAPGKKWGIAAVIGGVGAAVTAGLLALRGSTPVDAVTPDKGDTGEKAHQADGTDSSKSFAAGIADEGTIPE